MKHWVERFKEPKYTRISSFWGPVGIALGVICMVNVFNITATSISFEPKNGLANFVAGIILIIIGSFMALSAQDKTNWARVGLTAGLSIFFWGVQVVNIENIENTGLGIGWGVIIFALILLVMGNKWAPK